MTSCVAQGVVKQPAAACVGTSLEEMGCGAESLPIRDNNA